MTLFILLLFHLFIFFLALLIYDSFCMVIALLDISLSFVWAYIPLKGSSALFNNFYLG